MKVLITGGAGYIGSELVEKLSKLDLIKEIIIYDNLSAANYGLFFNKKISKNKYIKFIEGDILDSRKLQQSLLGVDIVYHLAAKVITPFSSKGADYFEQVNHWGTAELCYAIENTSVKKAIYMSSASVYGSNHQESFIDTFPAPNTAYGISKLRGEAHFERLKKDVNVSIIRCANTYGYSACLRLDSVINKFIFRAINNQIININGDGNQTRAFVSIEKVTSTLSNMTKNMDSGFQKINLVQRNLSINNIINTLKLIFPNLEIIYINQHLSLKNQIIGVEDIIGKTPFNIELTRFAQKFTLYKPLKGE